MLEIVLGFVFLILFFAPGMYLFEGFVESQKKLRGPNNLKDLGWHFRRNLSDAWQHLRRNQKRIPIFCRIARDKKAE